MAVGWTLVYELVRMRRNMIAGCLRNVLSILPVWETGGGGGGGLESGVGLLVSDLGW